MKENEYFGHVRSKSSLNKLAFQAIIRWKRPADRPVNDHISFKSPSLRAGIEYFFPLLYFDRRKYIMNSSSHRRERERESERERERDSSCSRIGGGISRGVDRQRRGFFESRQALASRKFTGAIIMTIRAQNLNPKGNANKRRIPLLNLRLRLLWVHFEIKFLVSLVQGKILAQ